MVVKARFFFLVMLRVFVLLATISVQLTSGITSVSSSTTDECPTETAACAEDTECRACFTYLPSTCGSLDGDSVSCTDYSEAFCCMFDEDCLANNAMVDLLSCGLATDNCDLDDLACLESGDSTDDVESGDSSNDECSAENAACIQDAVCRACFTDFASLCGLDNDPSLCTEYSDVLCCMFDDDCLENTALVNFVECGLATDNCILDELACYDSGAVVFAVYPSNVVVYFITAFAGLLAVVVGFVA